MKICVNCGAEIADEEIICSVCGMSADEAMEAGEIPEAEETLEAEDLPADEDESEAETASEVEQEPEQENEPEAEPEPEPKQNRWTGITTLIVIIAALIVLGLAAFLLYSNGTLQKWWDDIRPKTKSVCTMQDYSEIQVLRSSVEIDDETVDNYIASIIGSEVTDEAVQSYAAAHRNCDAQTVDEMHEYAHDYIYDYYLHNQMMDYLKGITEVTSYDEVKEAELIEYSAEQLEYTASTYGMDADTIASYYGYETALAYETETAHDYQKIIMILDKVAKDKNISYTDEELRSEIENYLTESGYTAYYTVDSFLEEAGDTWVYLYENLTYKFNLVMEALEPNVVLVDEPAE